ncbi:hypothetical protein E5K00_13340 [Hymenobacter aquaticus]|uniref:Uncharacterized protein n=1 Tax=Hymenobacter aquaticus TaxID=1867101 RepID=A0A4Z0PXV5_9BACT|nr:hypothetical protein [Hymenobacter aquaticus]TGE21272.1 hypothetical protein E5K00_13340 [Hymenobacter aquaticus]
MYKILLILFCAFLTLLDPQTVLATSAEAGTTSTELVEEAATPRPNYKPYRGNSRHKAKKLGVFRRWKLRRKAMRKRKHKALPVIKVDKPTRNK